MRVVGDRGGTNKTLTVRAGRTIHPIAASLFDKWFLATITVPDKSRRHGLFDVVSCIAIFLLLIFYEVELLTL